METDASVACVCGLSVLWGQQGRKIIQRPTCLPSVPTLTDEDIQRRVEIIGKMCYLIEFAMPYLNVDG